MKKYLFLLVLIFSITLSACSKSEEDKLNEFLNENISYEMSVELNDSEVNIKIPMVNIREDLVQHASLVTLGELKEYPNEEIDLFKEVNIQFFEQDTGKLVAEVQVTRKTFVETDWTNLDSSMDIPETVDSYNYKWEQK